MKMILAIINQDDANIVVNALMHEGYHVKRPAQAGGFVRAGNRTILIGVDDDKVEDVIRVIQKHSHSRKQVVPTTTDIGTNYLPSMPVEVTVGGATLFVLNVERFDRV